jgi:hypothetical protein
LGTVRPDVSPNKWQGSDILGHFTQCQQWLDSNPQTVLARGWTDPQNFLRFHPKFIQLSLKDRLHIQTGNFNAFLTPMEWMIEYQQSWEYQLCSLM